MTEADVNALVLKLRATADDYVICVRDREKNQFLWACSDYNWAIGACERVLVNVSETQYEQEGD